MASSTITTISEKYCQICRIRGEKVTASYLCNDCCVHFCEECQVKHTQKPVYSGHVVQRHTPLCDVDICCTVHQTERAQYWCNQCDKAQCIACVMDDHDTHDKVHPNQYVSELENESKDLKAKICNLQTGRKESLEIKTKVNEKMLKTYKATKQQIKIHCTKLRKQIMQREEEMLLTLHTTFSQKSDNLKNDIQLEKQTLQEIHAWLENAATILETPASPNLISYLKEMKTTGRKLTSINTPDGADKDFLIFQPEDSMSVGKLAIENVLRISLPALADEAQAENDNQQVDDIDFPGSSGENVSDVRSFEIHADDKQQDSIEVLSLDLPANNKIPDAYRVRSLEVLAEDESFYKVPPEPIADENSSEDGSDISIDIIEESSIDKESKDSGQGANEISGTDSEENDQSAAEDDIEDASDNSSSSSIRDNSSIDGEINEETVDDSPDPIEIWSIQSNTNLLQDIVFLSESTFAVLRRSSLALYSIDYNPITIQLQTEKRLDGHDFRYIAAIKQYLYITCGKGKCRKPVHAYNFKDGKFYTGKWPSDALSNPSGVALTADGKVVICDRRDDGSRKVSLFDCWGNRLKDLSNQDTNLLRNSDIVFLNPLYVSCNAGKIIVSDAGAHCIYVFDEEGEELFRFGSHGNQNGQLDSPHGVCADSEGNILVVDKRNHRITQFDSEGRFLKHVMTSNNNNIWSITFTQHDGIKLLGLIDNAGQRTRILRL